MRQGNINNTHAGNHIKQGHAGLPAPVVWEGHPRCPCSPPQALPHKPKFELTPVQVRSGKSVSDLFLCVKTESKISLKLGTQPGPKIAHKNHTNNNSMKNAIGI